jgi:hypothetical protein
MSISTVGGGYQFLPPVIRPDANGMSASTPDISRSSTTGAATAPGASPADAAPALDTTAAHTTAGKHLLRITV